MKNVKACFCFMPPFLLVKYLQFSLATTISTDRFINVNFENKAGEEIILYPDKGEHKNTGYSIKPRMILELRLVEQGTQTNFPVTFRAKSVVTGEFYPLDGELTFMATPSEKSTQVYVTEITRPCKSYTFKRSSVNRAYSRK